MSRKLIIGTVVPVAAIIVAAVAFAVFEPIQVLPRLRLAPGFLLTDQHAATLTSEDVRGDIVLYNFGYSDCGAFCDQLNETVREVQARLDEVDIDDDVNVRFVTISFDPAHDTPAVLDAYATSVGADGEQWQFATAEPDVVANVVKAGFETWYEERAGGQFAFDPAFVLVDGWGVIRGEYRYETTASDADKILHHLDILGEEIRNAHGAAGLAYSAAHFFLCYP